MLLRSKFASLPVVVVLPAPCRPTIIITVGGLLATAILLCSPPISSVSSSCTTLITCCPVSNFHYILSDSTFRHTLYKIFTTLKLTSASKRARRTSLIISFTSASETFPLPRIFASSVEVGRLILQMPYCRPPNLIFR